jgi:hypothetical protein
MRGKEGEIDGLFGQGLRHAGNAPRPGRRGLDGRRTGLIGPRYFDILTSLPAKDLSSISAPKRGERCNGQNQSRGFGPFTQNHDGARKSLRLPLNELSMLRTEPGHRGDPFARFKCPSDNLSAQRMAVQSPADTL